ncbi:MAG: hypothetical protein K6T65_16395, partial [Peptococcaceae bacterium]|nr:hypothetical protein [Peptococcaceae bacterium]
KQLNENELEHCRQVFRLSDAEVMALRNAQRGEGILVAGSRRVHLEVKVPEGLHRLITTNPAEL